MGSIIRLPFGVHRKSGKVYPFVNIEDGLPIADTPHGQLLKLWKADTVSRADIDKYAAIESKEIEVEVLTSATLEPQDNVWSRIRAAETAIAFIGSHVELKLTRKGAVGHCPFHEDSVESFSINREDNYWNCFAGCGGGSIIDFWMKWKNIELGEAVRELKVMLEVE